jgi:DNA-binding beta-propeller fold protein YncE
MFDFMTGSHCHRGLMRAFLAASLLLLMAAEARAADPAPLVVEAKIPLGEVHGRIDHFGVDVKRHRLYVAELGNDSVGVVDLQAGKTIRTLAGLKEPQGIGYDGPTDTLYVANDSDGSVRLFKGEDLSPLGRIDLGDDADNVRIEEAAHQVWVGYGSGALAIIDANSRRKVMDIPLKAHPESFRFAPAGSLIYVNVPNNGEIAVVDRSSKKQIASWKTRELRSNYPLALDESGNVLAVFRHPARLAVFRAQDGKRLQALETCGDSDDLFVDSKRHRVYVTCGEGFVDVFSRAANGYQQTGKLETSSGARTSLFVPELDRLYLAVRAGLSRPASIWVVRPESGP